MLATEMKEGGKISIIVGRLDFSTEIEVIRDEYLLVRIIVVDKKIVSFPPGVKVDMVYFDEDNKLHVWENIKITAVKFKDGKKYNKIDMPKQEGKKYNRRSEFRLYVAKECCIDIKDGTKVSQIKVTVKDISANGFAFVSSEEYKIGSRVTLYYTLESGRNIDVTGKIVRSRFVEEQGIYIYGCELNATSDILRREINGIQQKKIKDKLS